MSASDQLLKEFGIVDPNKVSLKKLDTIGKAVTSIQERLDKVSQINTKVKTALQLARKNKQKKESKSATKRTRKPAKPKKKKSMSTQKK